MTLNHVLADDWKFPIKRFLLKDFIIDYGEPIQLNIANVINVERKQI